MIAGKWRAPIREEALKLPFGEMRTSQPFGYISNTETSKGSVQHLRRRIANELAFDADFQFAATFLKFPGIESAMRQTQGDAILID